MRDHTGEWRGDPRVALIELRGFQSGFGLLHERTVVARMVVVLRAERRFGLRQLMLGESLVGHRDAQSGVGLIVLLGGDDALFLQRLGAREIDSRLLEL